METARNRLTLAINAKQISSANLKNAQSIFDAAQVVTATTHAALVAALAHEKEAHLDRSRTSAGRGASQNGCSGSTDIAGVMIQLKASVIAAKDADDNARQTLVSANRALDLAKSYHEEAIGRLNEAVGSFIFI